MSKVQGSNNEISTDGKSLPSFFIPKSIKRSDASSRKNKIADENKVENQYSNISDAYTPFNKTGSDISIKDIIDLCQKAYTKFSSIRNVVELMVEFSTNKIYYRGGTAKSRKFFETLFDSVGLWNLQEQFFREAYRSGSIFIHRQDGKIKDEDVNKLIKLYDGGSARIKLPIRYTILNPIDIVYEPGISFAYGTYKKMLNAYDAEQLKSPKTPQDKAFLESLDKETRMRLQKGNKGVYIKLDPATCYSVFIKKQDYEPFSIPIFYPVLRDINYKEELKKVDLSVARTLHRSILLVNAGAKPEEGGVNPEVIAALEEHFQNEDSSAHTLVADYTVKVQFVTPDIAEILSADKYEQIEKDIKAGLNDILIGSEEKFANQSVKVKLFIEKLRQARQAFINMFLKPEIERISDIMGFKGRPVPYFQEYEFKDDLEYSKLYTRLGELGILTPSEVITAIDSGILPDEEDSLINQRKLKDYREDNMYVPAQQGGMRGEAGRPTGISTKMPNRKPSPVSAKILDIVQKYSSLDKEVESYLKESHKLESLNEEQSQIKNQIVQSIACFENPEDWSKKMIEKHISSEISPKEEILLVAEDNNLSLIDAAIIHYSQ